MVSLLNHSAFPLGEVPCLLKLDKVTYSLINVLWRSDPTLGALRMRVHGFHWVPLFRWMDGKVTSVLLPLAPEVSLRITDVISFACAGVSC